MAVSPILLLVGNEKEILRPSLLAAVRYQATGVSSQLTELVQHPFGVFAADDQLVEPLSYQLHAQALRVVVMNDSKRLDVVGTARIGADSEPPGPTRPDHFQPGHGVYCIIYHSDLLHRGDRHADVAMASFDLL